MRSEEIRNDTIRYDTMRYDTMRCDAMRCDVRLTADTEVAVNTFKLFVGSSNLHLREYPQFIVAQIKETEKAG